MYLASERKDIILKTLAKHGAARTVALAKQMQVTDETVRNDLINLEKKGFLKRVHGGALALNRKSLHEDVVAHDDVSIGIAKKVVQHIPNTVVMFLDDSSMGYAICNHLNTGGSHIVTNNPNLLAKLAGMEELNLYCTGGRYDRKANAYVGQDAAHAAGSLNIGVAVLSPDCYSPKHGVGYANALQAEFIKSLIPTDAKLIVAIPSERINDNPAFFQFSPNRIALLVTDANISAEAKEAIEQNGVTVEIA